MAQRIPAEEVFANRRSWGPKTKWPKRGEGNRLDGYALLEPNPKFRLDSIAKIFTIGSCFARNIESHFHKMGFDVPTVRFSVPPSEHGGRPSGILNKYTPASIYQELEWTLRAMGKEAGDPVFDETLLVLNDDAAIDLELAGFVRVAPDRAHRRRIEVRDVFAHAFESDMIALTLGLAEAWWDNERQRYIQQVPSKDTIRMYPGRFAFELLSFEKAKDFTRQSIELLIKHGRPGAKIFLTTSPVPLGHTFANDDILITNTHAKSLLRAVCGELAPNYPQVAYFPSYESVMMSNSPEVWAEDQIHVQDAMVGRIVKLLVESYFDESLQTKSTSKAVNVEGRQ